MKRFSLFLIPVLLLTLTACGAAGPGGDGGTGAAGGRLTVFGDDPPTLDPALTGDTASSQYVMEIYSGLVTLNQQLQIVPDMAESWDISNEGKTYTFKLRRNAKFHNGREVKAQDFQYSLDRAATPRIGSHTADTYIGDIKGVRDRLAGKSDSISGVKVIDDYTLQIDLDAARYYFLAKMTYPTAMVVAKENVESGAAWMDKPVGTGPFKMKEWKKGERIVLEKNAAYYTEPAKLDEVVVLLAGGNAMTMYENDEVDISPIGLRDIERIKDPSHPLNKEFVVAPSLDVWYIGLNAEVPPFDDVKVRQAFNHAIDKDKIIKVVISDLYQRADGIIPPGMPGYNPQVRGLKFDAELAKRLLRESKYAGNLPPVTFTIPSSATTVDPVTEALVEMFKTNLGVEVKIQQVEWATFLGDMKRNPAQNKKNKYQMYQVGWSADYPDPQDFVDIKLHSKSLDNDSAYSNAEADKLMDQARGESNNERRLQLYQQAEQIMVTEAAWVPMYHAKHYQLVKSKVKGYTPAPMSIPTYKYISVR